jgi:hypothetical protein
LFPCTVLMLRFRLELGLDIRAMVTTPMGIILMATTDHIITATMGLHTIGLADIGTTATTVIITTIGNRY